jgi:hypothetical protein
MSRSLKMEPTEHNPWGCIPINTVYLSNNLIALYLLLDIRILRTSCQYLGRQERLEYNSICKVKGALYRRTCRLELYL